MERLNSGLGTGRLAESYWKLRGWTDGAGVEMTALQFHPSSRALLQHEAIAEAVAELEGLTGRECVFLMFNKLDPGAAVPVHVDSHPDPVDRWHLPVITNDDAFWWDEAGGEIHMAPGFWWGPVPFDIPHRVRNDGPTPRIHLVVDVQ